MVDRSHSISGADVEESVVFSNVDDLASSRGVWVCGPGVFDIYTQTEFFTIVQGSALLTMGDGTQLQLDAGTTGCFKGGEPAVWDVKSSIVKSYQLMSECAADSKCHGNATWIARSCQLEDEPMEPSKSWISEGRPEVCSTILATYAYDRVLCGIWRCTPGSVTYVEEDEIFTVIAGRATVSVESGPTLDLFPGVIGEFKKGDIATFQVHDTFLKTFQITMPAPSG